MPPTFEELGAMNKVGGSLFDPEIMELMEDDQWLLSARRRCAEIGYRYPEDFILYRHKGTGMYVFAVWVKPPRLTVDGKGVISALFSMPYPPNATEFDGMDVVPTSRMGPGMAPAWPNGEELQHRLRPVHAQFEEAKKMLIDAERDAMNAPAKERARREEVASHAESHSEDWARRIRRGEVAIDPNVE